MYGCYEGCTDLFSLCLGLLFAAKVIFPYQLLVLFKNDSEVALDVIKVIGLIVKGTRTVAGAYRTRGGGSINL